MPDTSSTLVQAQLASHRYGKSRVRLMRVTRHETHHDLDEWTVEILLTGDFAEVFTHGDNTRVLATDTMKNTVYFLARSSRAESIEAFAQELIDFLLRRNPQVTAAEVTIQAHLWKRLTVEGQPYPTAFMKGSDERGTTYVTRTQDGAFNIRSGFENMTVLKTAQSGFVGFIRDELTTLPETTDRLFGTSVTAQWSYTADAITAGIDFNKVRHHLRERMVTTFAKHDSLSVQQTLFAMAEAALGHTDLIDEVFLRMPNKHNLLVDLGRFGSDNPNHIFVPTDEPHGTIEATVRRS
ncbi:MAG TPA: urate oxidase [Acidobacteriaceae bacterium]|nr:urate oxidase [Acidobacteriaceae bacterium]